MGFSYLRDMNCKTVSVGVLSHCNTQVVACFAAPVSRFSTLSAFAGLFPLAGLDRRLGSRQHISTR